MVLYKTLDQIEEVLRKSSRRFKISLFILLQMYFFLFSVKISTFYNVPDQMEEIPMKLLMHNKSSLFILL